MGFNLIFPKVGIKNVLINKTYKCMINLSYTRLVKALSYLRNLSCHFIATDEDASLPTTGDIVIPGCYADFVLPLVLFSKVFATQLCLSYCMQSLSHNSYSFV